MPSTTLAYHSAELPFISMHQGHSIRANVLWETDWPEELETPRAILRIIMEHGGEPFRSEEAWKQLDRLIARNPIEASSLISALIRTVLEEKASCGSLQSLETATRAVEAAPTDKSARAILQKRILLCYRLGFESHTKTVKAIIDTAERDKILDMAREYVAGLGAFMYCARQTHYDYKAATKHRPQSTHHVIAAISAMPDELAKSGSTLQARLRKLLSPFLPAGASELQLLRETLYQLYLALLNFEIYSDIIPHRDSDASCELEAEIKRLHAVLHSKVVKQSSTPKDSTSKKTRRRKKPAPNTEDPTAKPLEKLATEAAALRTKVLNDLPPQRYPKAVSEFNEAMQSFYASTDRIDSLRKLRSNYSDTMVYTPKVPVVPQNRRLIFCLQQADRLLKLVQEQPELRNCQTALNACMTIYETVQKLLCIQPTKTSLLKASGAIVTRARALKVALQPYTLSKDQTSAFNAYMNAFYKRPMLLEASIATTRQQLSRVAVTERTRMIRQVYHKAVRLLRQDIPEFGLQYPEHIHDQEIQSARNLLIEVLKKGELLLSS